LSPGGSGYFTCIQNMKMVTTKFKLEGLYEKHESWEPSQHLLLGTGKQKKNCVEVAGRRISLCRAIKINKFAILL